MEVSELNKLLKMHRQMSDVMKKMGRGGCSNRPCVECLGRC